MQTLIAHLEIDGDTVEILERPVPDALAALRAYAAAVHGTVTETRWAGETLTAVVRLA